MFPRLRRYEAMVKTVVDTFGHLDYALIMPAVVVKAGWLAEIEEQDWDKTAEWSTSKACGRV